MSGYWRSADPSNKPETCLWCGKKLRWQTRPVETGPAEGESWADYWKRDGGKAKTRAAKPGDYQDGHFCGLRCGYQFGVAMADHGRRLSPKGA